uniref:Uncharacterized protein n=1 Tax=Tanacetum cinerariifolium TaxID=118510 RepID=A0A699J075_TANCI|nr:hypothetical protein [Tanacetum cinerariifolium]
MLVEQEIEEEGDADEHVEEVNTGDDAHGDDSATHGEVPTVTKEPSIPSPTPPTPPPQPSQDIPSTSQVQQTPPQSPRVQQPSPLPQPKQQVVDFPMSLLQEAMDACAALTRRVEHLEYDKDDAIVLKETKEEDKEVPNKDVEEAKDDETEPAEVQEVVDVVTTTKLITECSPARIVVDPSRRRKGVVIRDPEEESTTSTIIPAETKSKDKGKGILVEGPKPLKKKQQVKTDEQYARELHAELNKDIDWEEAIDHVKRKAKEDPAINETPAKRATKRRKLDKEVEDLKIHLQIVPNEDDDVYIEATPLARKVPVMDYEIIEINNKPYYKIIRANGTHQLYISLLTLLRNFDREDLEALWSLVNERFSIAKPKNFSDDFLLTTLGAMFETPDAHAQI